jgi:hypothetical protein
MEATPEDAHSDTDSEYTPHSPTPAFPPNRPLGDNYSHLDFADSSPEVSDTDSDYSSGVEDSTGSRGRGRIPERVGNFVLLAKHKLVGTQIHVAKWKSEKSGLSVIWSDTPVSSVYFCLLSSLNELCI